MELGLHQVSPLVSTNKSGLKKFIAESHTENHFSTEVNLPKICIRLLLSAYPLIYREYSNCGT